MEPNKEALLWSGSPKTPSARDTLKIYSDRGWSSGPMVLGKLSVPGRPTVWITVGQGSTALAVGAGGGCLDICTLICSQADMS